MTHGKIWYWRIEKPRKGIFFIGQHTKPEYFLTNEQH